MNITFNEKQNSKVAVLQSSGILLNTAQDALDLLANLFYTYECKKAVINKSNIVESFFDLKTGIAGEILQKFTNYGFKIAIVGDFSMYESKSLRDFIYESNNGGQVFFKGTEAEALDALHAA